MDFNEIGRNLMNAFMQLSSLRMIVSSPREKVADLPTLYGIVALLLAPHVVVPLAVLAFVFGYRARFEKDAYAR